MTAQTPEDPSDNLRFLTGRMLEHSSVHVNVRQVFIQLTEDKIRICLMRHLERVEQRDAWQAPLGIGLSLLLALLTTTFTNQFGLSADTWRALFIFGTIASGVWLIVALRRRHRQVSIDDVIAELRDEAVRSQLPPS